MKKTFFEFRDYKPLLLHYIQQLPQPRGFRASLADEIGCQRAFVSQVLQGEAHFNLEHGERICRFLRFSRDETNFFLLLIQHARAGTPGLRKHFQEQLEAVAESQLVIKNRIPTDAELAPEVRGKYYSSWIYGAIRVAMTIPSLRSREALAKKLGLGEAQFEAALGFLESNGLVERRGNTYLPLTRHLHLGNDSDLIVRHHTNWRLHALGAIANPKDEDVHYSSVVSLSKADRKKLRGLVVAFLEEAQATVRDSPEEELCVLCADFFEL